VLPCPLITDTYFPFFIGYFSIFNWYDSLENKLKIEK